VDVRGVPTTANSRILLRNGATRVLVTPFRHDGSLDLDGLDRVVDFVLGAGARGVTALGVMGESVYLSEEERERPSSRASRLASLPEQQ